MARPQCDTCAARNNGTLADYCYHVAFAESHPGDGRVIPQYPQQPRWCPGHEAEIEDEDWPA